MAILQERTRRQLRVAVLCNLDAIYEGTATVGSTTTVADGNLSLGATDDDKGNYLYFTGPVSNLNIIRRITSSAVAASVTTFTWVQLTPMLGRVGICQSTVAEEPQVRRVDLRIPETDQMIYGLSALTAHPKIECTVFRCSDVAGPKVGVEVHLHVRLRSQPLSELPASGKDSRGREFALGPGPRAPEGATPLLLTFETDDGRALAAVYYYTVEVHQQGSPDIQLRAVLPLEWREGTM